MSSNDTLTRLGVWLYRLARIGQVLTVVSFIFLFVILPILVFVAIKYFPDGGEAAAKFADIWNNEGTLIIAGLVAVVIMWIFEYRALARLADIGWLLIEGEVLSDRLADAWWRFAHAIAIAGAIKIFVFTFKKISDNHSNDLSKLDYFPDFSHIHFYLITIICCYSIAIILREAAKAKREAIAAKQENEGFI
jgi:hypothetical protein